MGGVYSRAALLPTKQQYISTYAGLPIEETEKFLTDARERYYGNIAATGKVGAALAQMDFLDKDDPLKGDWTKKINEHIKGIADDSNAWENAGFQTAMMASQFISDDNLQSASRGKVAMKEYTQKLDQRLASKSLNQDQYNYYMNKVKEGYQGVASGDDVSNYFGTPATAVDINKKVQEFARIKNADMTDTGWRWDKDKRYFIKTSGEVMRPSEIKKELKAWLMGDPETNTYIKEMEMINPEYANELRNIIDMSAEAIGYDNRTTDIKFAPDSYYKGGTKESSYLDGISSDATIVSPAAKSASVIDYFAKRPAIQAKIDNAIQTKEDALERFHEVLNVKDYTVGMKDGTIFVEDSDGRMMTNDDLDPVTKKAFSDFNAIIGRQDMVLNGLEQVNAKNSWVYKNAEVQALIDVNAVEDLKDYQGMDQDAMGLLADQYKESITQEEAYNVIDPDWAWGSTATDPIARAKKIAISQGDYSVLDAKEKEELDDRIMERMTDPEDFIDYVGDINQGDAAYIKAMQGHINDSNASASFNVDTILFTDEGDKKRFMTLYNAKVGTDSEDWRYVQTHSPQWFGDNNEKGFKYLSEDEIQNVGDVEVVGRTFDPRDNKHKIIYKVMYNDSGTLAKMTGLDKPANRFITMDMPPEDVKRLDTSYGKDGSISIDLIKSQLFSISRQQYAGSGKENENGIAGFSAGSLRQTEFETMGPNINVQFVPGADESGKDQVYIATYYNQGDVIVQPFNSPVKMANYIHNLRWVINNSVVAKEKK